MAIEPKDYQAVAEAFKEMKDKQLSYLFSLAVEIRTKHGGALIYMGNKISEFRDDGVMVIEDNKPPRHIPLDFIDGIEIWWPERMVEIIAIEREKSKKILDLAMSLSRQAVELADKYETILHLKNKQAEVQ